MTNEEIMEKCKKLREDFIAGSQNLYDRMTKAEDFKVGKQWDPAVRAANEAEGKFSLTIPLIKPTIKQVVGTEIQNPKDFKIRNVRSGSKTVANILTALSKHAMDSEQVRFEKSMFFESGLTTGAGALGFFIDKSEDPKHGNLVIEKLNEFEVIWDPNCKVYDPNSRRGGAKGVIWEPWVDKELIEAEYPDKKEEIGGGKEGSGVWSAMGSFVDWMIGAGQKVISNFSGVEREDIEVLEKHRYKMTHTWWREPKKCVMSYDSRKGELDAVLVTKDAEIKRAKKAAKQWPETFSTEDVVVNIMHHTIAKGEIFLEDRVDELNGVKMFSIVPFYPYFDNGYKAGMSEDLIGTQEEINWSHSQFLNLIKKLANSGWITGGGIEKNKQWLEDHAGEDGVVIDKTLFGNFLEKIEQNPPHAGFHLFEEKAKENFKLISNVFTEKAQFDKQKIGWQAMRLMQLSSLTGSAAMFLNYDYSMTIAGNLLIEIIRNNGIYSEEEIREIVDEEDLIDRDLMGEARQMVIAQLEQIGQKLPEPPTPLEQATLQQASPEGQQMLIETYQNETMLFNQMNQQIDKLARPIAEAMLLDEIRDMKRGQYNTKVTLSPYAPTLRMAKSAELFELNETLIKNQQLPVSRKLLVEATDVDNKEEIIEEGEQQMRQMQTAGAK